MEPLIHTSKGNLPVDSLEYSTRWEDSTECTTFIETYLLNGEVVKQSVHVMGKRGFLADGQAGSIGG